MGNVREAGNAYLEAGKLAPTWQSNGSLLDSLGDGSAPFGLGAIVLFFAFTFLLRVGSHLAQNAGVPEGINVLIVCLLCGGVLYFVSDKQIAKRQRKRLSPEAQQVLNAREEIASNKGTRDDTTS